MASSKRLIVGLGNPGAEYEGTRHNIGFEVLEELARQARIEWMPAGIAMVGEGSLKTRPVVLALPLTYVNRSGEAVQQLLAKHNLGPRELLIVVDDLHLPTGALRFRAKGSAAGHNGTQDIIDRLGANSFPRLRIGIGDDYPTGGQVDYVLSQFTAEERSIMNTAVEDAAQSIRVFVSDGLAAAMNRFN